MKKKSYGLSLAELLVVLSIFSVAASVAAPAVEQQLESQRRTETLNQMIGILGYARSSAAFDRRTAVVCTGTEDCADTPNWGGHLLIFHDTNDNARRDSDEPLLHHERLAEGYSWYWSSFRKLTYIVFQPDGTARAANGTLTLCRKGEPLYQIKINVAGRARYQSPASDAQCG